MSKSEYTSKTVATALDVFLLLCTPEFEPMTDTEIALQMELSRAKVYRIVRTLESKRFIKKSNGKWMPTPEIVKISDGFRRYVARKRAELEELENQYSK